MPKLSDKERFELICQRKRQCVDWLKTTEAITLTLALMDAGDDVEDKEALAEVTKAAAKLSKALWKLWDVYTSQMETPRNFWSRTTKEDA